MKASTPEAVGRTALFVAHPGHELRIYGWLERARPQVHVLTDGSVDVFRVECLRSVTTALGEATSPADPPYYEHYGRKQVEAGDSSRAIRLRDHLVPLAADLRRHVSESQSSSRCAS